MPNCRAWTHTNFTLSASIWGQHFEHWSTENRLPYPDILGTYTATSLFWTEGLFFTTPVSSQCSSAQNGFWLWPPVTQLHRGLKCSKITEPSCSISTAGPGFFHSRCLVLCPLRQHVSTSFAESGTWYVAYGVSKSREDTLLTAGTGHELISPLPGSSFAVPPVM